jgi:hypothetical protein
MKRIMILFVPVVLTFMVSSCKQEEEIEYTDIKGEIVYTDSFSPPEWESPVNRKNIRFGDMDIGLIIADDVMDPRQRTLLTTVTNFITRIQEGRVGDVKTLLTAASYNSFSLRYADIEFDDEFELRIGLPPAIEDKVYWVDFKLLFETRSLTGRVQVTWNRDRCVISDFEDDFFVEIMEKDDEE